MHLGLVISAYTLAASVAVAWTTDTDENYLSYDLDVSLDFSQPKIDEVWRTGSISVDSANSISLEISGNFSRLENFYMYVFDGEGAYIDSISLFSIDTESIWTDFIEGESVSLEVHGPRNLDEHIDILRARVTGQFGAPDVIPDGKPLFEEVIDPNLPVAQYQNATARLLVGRNSFPLTDRIPVSTPDWCSGFLISADLFMTASHCFQTQQSFCQQTVALFGYTVSFPLPVLARACKEIVYLNPYLDVAIIRLSDTESQIPPVELSALRPELSQPLLIVQHPHGAVSLISRDNCRVTDQNSALRPSRSGLDYALLLGLGFSHQCDTLEGSSGAAVFSQSGSVVGVHQGGKGTVNNAVRMDAILGCIEIDTVENTISIHQPLLDVCRNFN